MRQSCWTPRVQAPRLNGVSGEEPCETKEVGDELRGRLGAVSYLLGPRGQQVLKLLLELGQVAIDFSLGDFAVDELRTHPHRDEAEKVEPTGQVVGVDGGFLEETLLLPGGQLGHQCLGTQDLHGNTEGSVQNATGVISTKRLDRPAEILSSRGKVSVVGAVALPDVVRKARITTLPGRKDAIGSEHEVEMVLANILVAGDAISG